MNAVLMPEEPRINLSISHFNTSQLLRLTLASVRAQSYRNYSLIIYDACSSDNFLEVVREFSDIIDSWHTEPDHGFYDGLSKAFSVDRGEGIYCYINAGDIYLPYAFEAVAEIFSQHSIDWMTGLPSFRDYRMRLRPGSSPLPYLGIFLRHGLYDSFALPCIQQESTFWSYRLHRLIDLQRLSTYQLAGDGYLWRLFANFARLWIYNRVLSSFTAHGKHLSTAKCDYRKELRTLSCAYISLLPPALLYRVCSWFLRFPQATYRRMPGIIDG